MQNSLVLYPSYFELHSAILDDIEDKLGDMAFTHYASQLLENGLRGEEELEAALDKAITALRAAHLPAYKHFREVFICKQEGVSKDWLVSDLGFRLIIMNADVSNPAVAKWQVEVLSSR